MVKVVGGDDTMQLPSTKNMDTLATALLGKDGAAGMAHAMLFIMHVKGKLMAFDVDEMLIICSKHGKWGDMKRVSIGDKVLSVNNKPVKSLADMTAVLAEAPQGLIPVSFRFAVVPMPSPATIERLGVVFDFERRGYDVSVRHFEFQHKNIPLNMIIRSFTGKVLVVRTVEATIAWHMFLAGDRVMAIDDEIMGYNTVAKERLLAILGKNSCASVLIMRPSSNDALQIVDNMLNKIHKATGGQIGPLQKTGVKDEPKAADPKVPATDLKAADPKTLAADPKAAAATKDKSKAGTPTPKAPTSPTPPKSVTVNGTSILSSTVVSLPPLSVISSVIHLPTGDVSEFLTKEMEKRKKTKTAANPKSQLHVKTHINEATVGAPVDSTASVAAPVSTPLRAADSVYGGVVSVKPPAELVTAVTAPEPAVTVKPEPAKAAVSGAKKKELVTVMDKPIYVDIGCETVPGAILRKPARQ